MENRNEIILSFCIWGFDDITHNDITIAMGIQPVTQHFKGQKVNPQFLPVAKKNGWIVESPLGKYASFEDQMNSILDILDTKRDILKHYCAKYYCEFSLALYIQHDTEESTPWVHLNSRYNAFIREFNIEFDLDLYC